ncbi:YifB family Mg chelatase-like AAA ATPase [Marinicellulosiphila megalodicopiae]|uniref:YifB family Mg chelatase-like AAA ATPase n=1 Tax=Marinicellulosiphila megalodicopiae TaxID=2724896 RepID=UPI003BAFB34B
MSLSVVHSRAKVGVQAPIVTVEVHLSNGLPSMSIVGLPEAAVKESKDRVRSAIMNSHFEFPDGRITVNLAPADLPKEGGRFDLAIAIGILAASEQIPKDALNEYEFLGELALTGDIRCILGGLTASIASQKDNRQLILPVENAQEASLPKQATVYAAKSLLAVCAHLTGHTKLDQYQHDYSKDPISKSLCLSDVKGQFGAKRALEVAAAGAHNLLYFGPPGTGKTLLSNRLASILPPPTEEEALEIAAIQSIVGLPLNWQSRPFRAPHHTSSAVALVGGGSYPKPGEITLAHNGVLFLDELPEFSRQVLDVLREPLESGSVLISRAAKQMVFPAQFQLIAAMNPTPGGYGASDSRTKRYHPDQIKRYLAKLSGPFLDRIDMHVEVPALPNEILSSSEISESSADVMLRTQQARQRQYQRQQKSNAKLSNKEIEKFCILEADQKLLMSQAMKQMKLSARSYHRILKVARTVADMKELEKIDSACLSEALGYRQLEQLLANIS